MDIIRHVIEGDIPRWPAGMMKCYAHMTPEDAIKHFKEKFKIDPKEVWIFKHETRFLAPVEVK